MSEVKLCKQLKGIFRGVEKNYFKVETPGCQMQFIRPQEVVPALRGDVLKEGQEVTLEYRVTTYSGLWYLIA